MKWEGSEQSAGGSKICVDLSRHNTAGGLIGVGEGACPAAPRHRFELSPGSGQAAPAPADPRPRIGAGRGRPFPERDLVDGRLGKSGKSDLAVSNWDFPGPKGDQNGAQKWTKSGPESG